MIKRLACRPGFVFVLAFAWKIVLFVLSAQPVPANDAFFYDGAVVNLLLHGKYVNPALALALPISGTRVFSAYPPLYQGVLWLWMSWFCTSALVKMRVVDTAHLRPPDASPTWQRVVQHISWAPVVVTFEWH
jgi:hypothetical protein